MRMTPVQFPEEMERLVREVVASYEARVSSVEQIVESTHEMLESFRGQREAMRARLRETLAQAAHLRKCDFDTMMGGILVRQEERGRAIKETMRGYLREQREMAAALKEALARGETERIGSVKELLNGIEARREERERDIRPSPARSGGGRRTCYGPRNRLLPTAVPLGRKRSRPPSRLSPPEKAEGGEVAAITCAFCRGGVRSL